MFAIESWWAFTAEEGPEKDGETEISYLCQVRVWCKSYLRTCITSARKATHLFGRRFELSPPCFTQSWSSKVLLFPPSTCLAPGNFTSTVPRHQIFFPSFQFSSPQNQISIGNTTSPISHRNPNHPHGHIIPRQRRVFPSFHFHFHFTLPIHDPSTHPHQPNLLYFSHHPPLLDRYAHGSHPNRRGPKIPQETPSIPALAKTLNTLSSILTFLPLSRFIILVRPLS